HHPQRCSTSCDHANDRGRHSPFLASVMSLTISDPAKRAMRPQLVAYMTWQAHTSDCCAAAGARFSAQKKCSVQEALSCLGAMPQRQLSNESRYRNFGCCTWLFTASPTRSIQRG